MKQRNLKLSIPKPCHENWDKMNDAEKGRFCGVCSKTVVDFTRMKTEEIIDYIGKRNENVCGRVNTEVLEPLVTERSGVTVNPFRRAFSFLFFGVFVMMINACNRTQGEMVLSESNGETTEDTLSIESNKDSVKQTKPELGVFKDSAKTIKTESHKLGKMKVQTIIMGDTVIEETYLNKDSH